MTTFYRKILFRPMREPDPSAPLGVRSIGHYRLRPNELDRKMIKDFVQLFWSVKGAGVIHLKGKPFKLTPGMIAFYFPGDIHDLVPPAAGPAWEYRWLTLDGNLSRTIVEGFQFTNSRTYYAGPPPVMLFDRLTGYLQDVTLTGELRAGALAFEILSKAAEKARPSTESTQRYPRLSPSRRLDALDAFKERAVRSIQEHWANPHYGIEQIAAELNLHRSVFSRKFHAAFGLSPSNYLLRWRIQNAMNLLRNSDQPIAEVSQACGWEDPNYFARCIRKATGTSPVAFRRLGYADTERKKKT